MDFVKNSQDFLNNLYFNPSITVILGLILILYIAVAAPKAPSCVTNMLNNVYLKIAIILFIAYVASKDASLALILTIALLVTLQTANRQSMARTTLDNLKGNENFEQVQNVDYPAHGLTNSMAQTKSSNMPANMPTGMDKENLASFNPNKEKLLGEQIVNDLPKDIPEYVVNSIPLYAPSKEKTDRNGDFCGNDSSFNKNGHVDNGLLLLDDNKVKTEQKDRLPTNIAGQDNCSGNADVSNFTTGYSGLELANF